MWNLENVLKHKSLFRPLIKRLRLDCFYSNLFKCGIRVNEVQYTHKTTLVHKHEQQSLKVKHKNKGRENANTR